VGLQELFRSGFFGLFKYLGDSTGSAAFTKAMEVVQHAHVLVFGILVVVVILYLPNGIVGDWEKIRKSFVRSKPAA
jgi:branched-chain amino acid transport system permease protein